jgi:hypothetical protein
VETCAAGVCGAGTAPDCDDGLECTADACSEDLAACTHLAADADTDGHRDASCLGETGPLGDDCDDGDPNRFPGNMEVCDADHDEDCDLITFGYRDLDMDDYPDARCCNADLAGGAHCGDDCNDMAAGVHPTEADDCDGRDNDCDGETDEDGVLLYRDCDGDGFGDSTVFEMGCPRAVTAVECPARVASSMWIPTPGDCDDARAIAHPGAEEICNGLDDDCMLPDDMCPCDDGETRQCGFDAACRIVTGVCMGGAPRCPAGLRTGGEAEVCDGIDNNCDGGVDEGCPCSPVGSSRSCGATGALGDCALGTESCGPTGYAGCAGPEVESCGGGDESCNGRTDEGVKVWLTEMAIDTLPGCDRIHQDSVCARSISNACVDRTPPSRKCNARGGFGHLEYSGGLITVACVDAPRMSFVPGAMLRAHHAGCTGAADAYPTCKAAIHRFCAATGYATGFGFTDGADTFSVFCLTSAQAVFHSQPWADLARYSAGCASNPPNPVYCPHAVHHWCLDRGFFAGFGTVENSATAASFFCLQDY